MNKMLNNVLCAILVLGLIGLLNLTAHARRATGDLKEELSDKTLTLKVCKTSEKEFSKDDLGKDAEWVKGELAQMVPSAITLNADGTCEMTYASSYKDGKVVEEDVKMKGKWSVDGSNIKIMEDENGDNKTEENKDEKMTLKDASVANGVLSCAFAIQADFTGGVEKLSYTVAAK